MDKIIIIIFILGILLWPIYFLIWNYFYENQDVNEEERRNKKAYKKELLNKAFSEIQKKKENEKRIFFEGNEIHLINDIFFEGINSVETQVIKFEASIPEIKIYENKKYLRTYKIEAKKSNPDLFGQYFLCEVRINSDFSVQIEGLISKDENDFDKGEGVRFQPFFLTNKNFKNEELVGKGMFARGLHYSGFVSSGNLRLICNCDVCEKSFSVEFYHAGISEIQYFYSSNSIETLIVNYGEIKDIPFQLQETIDQNILKEVEAKLPKTFDGNFKYYNSFCCPHCYTPFNNFEKFKESRPFEYYVHYYLNKSPIFFASQ